MPWKKGQSGNPSGKKKISPDVKAAFAAACPDAVSTLVELLKSSNEAIRLRAADIIIIRHLGKPPEAKEDEAIVEDPRRRLVDEGDEDLDAA